MFVQHVTSSKYHIDQDIIFLCIDLHAFLECQYTSCLLAYRSTRKWIGLEAFVAILSLLLCSDNVDRVIFGRFSSNWKLILCWILQNYMHLYYMYLYVFFSFYFLFINFFYFTHILVRNFGSSSPALWSTTFVALHLSCLTSFVKCIGSSISKFSFVIRNIDIWMSLIFSYKGNNK